MTQRKLDPREEIRRALRESGVEPRRSRGQNFLFDPYALDHIASALPEGELAVEVGPGLGALTEMLVRKYSRVVVIEKEEGFRAQLTERFPKVQFLNTDVRNVVLEKFAEKGKVVVLGNLPYSLSTDIVRWAIEQRRSISSCLFLLQREFAERIASPPGNREYGSLSVYVQFFARTELGAVIGGDSFEPPTAVESRLLSLQFVPQTRHPECACEQFFCFVQDCFSKKRKTLLNSLLSTHRYGEKKGLTTAISKIGDPATLRAETMDLAAFAHLSQELGVLHSGASEQ